VLLQLLHQLTLLLRLLLLFQVLRQERLDRLYTHSRTQPEPEVSNMCRR
jgi:hypothetical protein